MKLAEYPRYTIIVRGYTLEQTDAIIQAMEGHEKEFAIEVTMNTQSAVSMIQVLSEKYKDHVYIGAGTVMNLDDERKAIEAGAQFLLGPQQFSSEMIQFAHGKDVLTVPAAFTPSEVTTLFRKGADIVKVFPAGNVGASYFKAIQAPLGKLPLMAVGGISLDNVVDYLNSGSKYVGIGSGMFKKADITNENIAGLKHSITDFLKLDATVK